ARDGPVVAGADTSGYADSVAEPPVIHQVDVVAVRVGIDARKNDVVRRRSKFAPVVGPDDDDLALEPATTHRGYPSDPDRAPAHTGEDPLALLDALHALRATRCLHECAIDAPLVGL